MPLAITNYWHCIRDEMEEKGFTAGQPKSIQIRERILQDAKSWYEENRCPPPVRASLQGVYGKGLHVSVVSNGGQKIYRWVYKTITFVLLLHNILCVYMRYT
jgi:hypothetical protein